ncbi:MAG: TrkH family potassium uptake protein [Methanomicrobiales archaeon]|nr:TrkH family potassium uptake protein [Burkholderiaceae bacterium]NLH25186.1 TrkH family potassium uptake protein [Methanomicrobiales archaeon]HNO07597.1 potassium transporter TrkG [Methanoregulaceae archaeon]HNW80737.1 potassium transporter TrkG [Methanoregulaceae archaeon]HOH80787.1 potassium transporter TrkG [Methanoregulaceae archaeon]
MGRMRYFSTVFAELGGMLEYIGPMTAVPLLIAVAFREYSLLLPMAAVPATLFALGFLLNRLPRRKEDIRLSSAFCSVALVWLVFALVSTIPFILVLDLSLTDALFETMAGWTGTGFSLLHPSGYIPETLLFWRTFMQWIGGIGVIALSITMAGRGGLVQSPLFRSDSRSERILPGVIATGKEIWAVYVFLTLIGAGVILIAGVPLYEAIMLSLTTISTGGYLPFEGGLAIYESRLLEYLLIPVMIVGATPFTLYYISYRKRKLSLFGNEQVKLLLLFLAAGSAVVIADLHYLNSLPLTEAVRQGLFFTAAAISTTGYQGQQIQLFPSVTIVFLMLLMFIGGSSESSAGGVKLSRIAIGYRGILWWFKRVFVRTKVLVPFMYGGVKVPESVAEPELSKNMLVIILSVLTVFIATMVVLQFHLISLDVTNLVFDIVSALSSCGLSAGYVTPGMPFVSKWVFIIVMWIGRLEVIPVIVLLLGIFRAGD